jgi:MFS family permease
VAAFAALLCAWSVARGSFAGLCAAGFLLGGNMAFVQQYRFAATEFVPAGAAGRAVATVMLGTLAAAFAAPAIGELARDLGGWREFTGSFLVLSLLCIAAALVLSQLPPATVATGNVSGPARPLRSIASQPAFRLAVFAGIVAYAVMSFIMTATPISMHVHDGFSSGQTSAVISAHLVGMYLPSLATPWFIDRLGLRGMMLAGIAAMALCIAVSAFIGHAFAHYFAGLVLLGVGWNFLFVAATTLLTTTYADAERFRAQGLNDFAVFGSQACASLLAGSAIGTLGWGTLNLVALPLLVLVAIGALRLRRPAAAGGGA